MSLTFTEEGHIYQADGQIVPSVTQILQPFFYLECDRYVYILQGRKAAIPISKEVWEAAADLGTAVHLATSLYDNGELDTDDLDDQIRPYLAAWDQFKRDNQVEILANERRLFDPHLRYAGTLDRLVKMKRAPIKRRRTVLLDIKSGSVVSPDYVGMQTAAYAHLSNTYENTVVECRLCVQLNENGTYKMEWLDDTLDWQDFVACLNIHKRKERYD